MAGYQNIVCSFNCTETNIFPDVYVFYVTFLDFSKMLIFLCLVPVSGDNFRNTTECLKNTVGCFSHIEIMHLVRLITNIRSETTV